VVGGGYPQRGEIWDYVQGSRQYRILIVSNDEYNEMPGAIPWALSVERDAPAIPGYLVPLDSGDPLPGAVVVIPRVLRCDPTALRRKLGFVRNETINAVERGLREFLNLP
jgi:mRNA-degrading endonuclease toxin of MazEF toxin-antitoxin module